MSESIKTSISNDDFQLKLESALNMIVFRKIASDGYYDMAHFDDHPHAYDVLASLTRNGHTELVKENKEFLIDDKQQVPAQILNELSEVIEGAKFNDNVDESECLEPEEANAIVDFVRMMIPKCDYKIKCKHQDVCDHQDECKLKQLMEIIFNKAYNVKHNIKCDRGLIYDADKIEVERICSVSDMLSSLEDIHSASKHIAGKQKTFFYRGHSDSNYLLLPTVMRTKKIDAKERAIYQQLMIECPDELAQCQTHLERLSKMQHYGLETRLLDVTRNPLVALYFACKKANERDGEVVVLSQETAKIKDFDSDTVAVLASLPLFTRQEQADMLDIARRFCHDDNKYKCKHYSCKCTYRHIVKMCKKQSNLEIFNNKKLIHRLAHEVRQEKPGFISEIVPQHLLGNYFVQALKDTPRIIRQDGAFIICGLEEITKIAKDLHDFRYECVCGKKKLIIVDRHSKNDIRDELESLSIHSRSLMPEIENVARQIESSIKDQIGRLVR